MLPSSRAPPLRGAAAKEIRVINFVIVHKFPPPNYLFQYIHFIRLDVTVPILFIIKKKRTPV